MVPPYRCDQVGPPKDTTIFGGNDFFTYALSTVFSLCVANTMVKAVHIIFNKQRNAQRLISFVSSRTLYLG